jgi:predicted glycosyltransferase
MNARAPRILFQAHSRRGLGHLARGLNIARELRTLAPAAEITFHVSNAGAASCCPPAYRCLVESGVAGATPWADVLRLAKPDVSVFDTVLRPDDVAITTSRRAFVLRKAHAARHADLVSSGTLEQMDLVIIPHGEREFDSPLPGRVRERTAFVGPIVRVPSREAQEALRRKYVIAPGDFVLTSTVGGGGFAETAARLFAAVSHAHELLAPLLPTLRHVVVLGPQCSMSIDARPGMTVVQSEPELVNLMALSTLVIAEAGYNTVNELRAVKTPALFVPGVRTYDDQEERARALATLGLARVLTGPPEDMARDIVAVATSKDAIDGMRRSYADDRLEPGNRAAAERILELVR